MVMCELLVSLRLLEEMIIVRALICPTAAGSRWQGTAVVCVATVKAIITSLHVLWIPLDVQLSSLKPSLMETITNPTPPLNSPGGGSSADINLNM